MVVCLGYAGSFCCCMGSNVRHGRQEAWEQELRADVLIVCWLSVHGFKQKRHLSKSL